MLLTIEIIIVLVLAYTWLVYPFVIRKLAGRRPVREPAQPATDESLPRAAVLLSAHEEEATIAARLENLLELDYPFEKLRIFVGIDGGSDNTGRIAEYFAKKHRRVHSLISPENRGKSAMLKDLVSMAEAREPDTEILAFTDANVFFHQNALRLMAHRFADPYTGGVCGRLVLTTPKGSFSQESAYWKWETRMKLAESGMDSCLGANGAIYAIRKGVFWEQLPANTVVDDFVIGMKVRESGLKMVFEPAAVAEEEAPGRIRQEWSRRVRIGSGDYQALVLCRACLLPRFGKFAFMFWSHKVLRWFTPHLFIVLLILSGIAIVFAPGQVLWSDFSMVVRNPAWGPHFVILLLFLVLVICAGIGRLAARLPLPGKRLFAMCDHFVSMQAALFAGFIRFCTGRLSGTWQRTSRS